MLPLKLKNYILAFCVICLQSCIKNLTDEELIQTYQESISTNQWEKALSCVQEGLSRNPKDSALYFSTAFCLKNINPTKNYQEIIKNISLYLTYDKVSSRGRLLKYTSHYENKQYAEAIHEVQQIEKYYGISGNTLLMKANAQFLKGDYKNAAFNYEEATMFPFTQEKFEKIYYYKIYAKYFAGNKEGAMWDVSFLENHGLKENVALLNSISHEQLSIDDYNTIPFYANAEAFDKVIRMQVNLEYDQLMNPLYGEKLFFEPKYKNADLKSLDKDLELLNLSGANIVELSNEIKNFKNLKALNLSRNHIKDFDKLFQQLSELPNLEYLELNYSNLKNFPASISKLQQLKGLSVEASNIRKLPKEIGTLLNLGYLSVRNNGRFKDLP